MIFVAVKLALFATAWLLGRAMIRAVERSGGLATPRARMVLHAALAVVVALYWFPELRWMVMHPGETGEALGILALTAVPVGAFVLFLRWAHRRARENGDKGS